MVENLFMRDEDGVAAVRLPVASCDGFNCLDNGDVPLAMAYVPMQRFEDIYDVDQAFCAGTLFCDLNKPFLGKKAKQGGLL